MFRAMAISLFCYCHIPSITTSA